MKVHFYILTGKYAEETFISHYAVPVSRETDDAYWFDRIIPGYCRKSFKKENIGMLVGPILVLREHDPDYARKIYEEDFDEQIEELEAQLSKLRRQKEYALGHIKDK